MQLTPAQRERLTDALSEMFGESVQMQELRCQQLGDALLAVVEMSYTRTHHRADGPDTTTTIRQTAVMLDDDQVDVPQFALSPRRKGLVGKLFAALGGMADVSFPDSPEFSAAYRLHAWNESAARILFSPTIRERLVTRPGWSARGQGSQLIVFKHDQICDEAEMDRFVEDALEILQWFQEGEETLDQRPDIRRDTRVRDMLESTDRMGGIAGAMLRNQLNKIAFSQQQYQAFLSQPCPRNLPDGMKRQVIGDNLFVIVLGLAFLVAGCVAAAVTATQLEGRDRLISVLATSAFACVGGVIIFIAARFRIRKTRLLRNGKLTQATIIDVKRTDVSINNQRRYHVKFDYAVDGTQRSTTANLYNNIDKARALQTSGDTVRLLVDPEDTNHVVCLDLLVVMD